MRGSTRRPSGACTIETVHTLRTPPTRPVEAGVALDLMVLADSPDSCATVDVSSGALVRARFPGRPERPLRPFDVVRGVLADDPDGPDPTQPEAVTLAGPPEVVGRLKARPARRLLGPLLLPAGAEPFGFPGSAAPYWTVPGDRPSLALLHPQAAPRLVRRGADRVLCHFAWRGVEMELPVVDRAVRRALAAVDWPTLSGRSLARALGFDPSHLVLALTNPRDGRCYKVVTGFLPRP